MKLWRISCALGRHHRPVTVFGMVEQSERRGLRNIGGYRCACGALVFTKFTDWRDGAGARRALKREAVRT